MSAPSGVVCAAAPPASWVRAAWESVQTTTGAVDGSPSRRWKSSRAARRATNSALVLEHSAPAGARTSLTCPDGRAMCAPPPPSVVPPEAEPSDQIQVALVGRFARCSSAVVRRTESGAERQPPGPTSRAMWTDPLVVHGGAVTLSRCSTAVSEKPAFSMASRPILRQPVVELRRLGAVASTVARSGSSAGRDFALQTMRVARTRRRVSADGRPASARSGATGVDCGQPVITLAAEWSSRSISST